MEPMYNPQNDVGSIKAGFTRNYSQDEVNALKSYVASHTGSMGSLVDRLTGAGIPLQDIATLTKAVNRSPSVGVDMGGGYGGVATRQGPYTPSATNPGALAGLASQMPSRMPSGYGVAGMEDRIPSAPSSMPNRIPQSAMLDDPSLGYQNSGSSIAQMQRDLYPPQQPASSTGGVYGPGGMFPSQGLNPGFMTDPYRGDPIYPGYSVDPYTPNPSEYAPRAPNDGISQEYYHGDPYAPTPMEYAPRGPDPQVSNEYYHATPDNAIPRDPLGELMGQIQNDNVTQQTQAFKNGGVAEISKHPALMKFALGNRR